MDSKGLVLKRCIVQYLMTFNGMSVVPCSIPLNRKEHKKRDFYILIKNKISEKLFYFLKDKVSPIKYLPNRPGGEVHFHLRNEEGVLLHEFCLENKRPDLWNERYEFHYFSSSSSILKIETNFYKNNINKLYSDIDKYLSFFSHFSSMIRERNINQLIN